MLVATAEGKMLGVSRIYRQFVDRYLYKYQTLVDTLVTHTKHSKLDGKKGCFILPTIAYFCNIPLCSKKNA
jgi:hypothetical protein